MELSEFLLSSKETTKLIKRIEKKVMKILMDEMSRKVGFYLVFIAMPDNEGGIHRCLLIPKGKRSHKDKSRIISIDILLFHIWNIIDVIGEMYGLDMNELIRRMHTALIKYLAEKARYEDTRIEYREENLEG